MPSVSIPVFPSAVTLSCDPPGPNFTISDQAVMPRITVTATLKAFALAVSTPLQYQWKVTLGFTGQGCLHSLNRFIKHPDIVQTTTVNKLAIPFSAVRGGALSVSVTVRVGPTTLTAQSQGLQIIGTNPTIAGLQAATLGAPDRFKKLMRLESGLHQFRSPACPLFSADNAGGVGLCQLTSPAPTDDQVWNWKENLKGGLALWNGKKTNASNYPAHVRKSVEFQTLVKNYNTQRMASKTTPLPQPLQITLPDYTSEQLERDTLRGFNGYAGQLHEYRAKVDANGMLVVTVDPSGTTGTAEWERLTAAQRIAVYDKINLGTNHRGDPNYVDDVEKQASF